MWIAITTCFWVTLFVVFHSPDDAVETKLSAARAIINLSIIQYAVTSEIWRTRSSLNPNLSSLIMTATTSVVIYNIVDTIFMLLTRSKFIVPFVPHHLFVILGCSIPLMTGRHWALILGGFVIEFTSLLMNIRLLIPYFLPVMVYKLLFIILRILGNTLLYFDFSIDASASMRVKGLVTIVIIATTIFNLGAVHLEFTTP